MPARGSQYQKKPGHREIGCWAWNDNRLWNKIQKADNDNDCFVWTGSVHPAGALMGAWKNNQQQMTQARRLVWMSVNNEDVSAYRVTMKCGNPLCVNHRHFELKPSNRTDQQ